MGFSLRVLFESDLWLLRSARPAQASLTLRPAGSLSRPQATFVTRLHPMRLPAQAARQLLGRIANGPGRANTRSRCRDLMQTHPELSRALDALSGEGR